MKVIIPCAGKSSRFPNVRPKWMLNSPNGNLMVIDAIRGLDLREDIEIVIVLLKEHEEKYSIVKGLKENFSKYFKNKLEILLLNEQTKSQSETIYKTIKLLDIKDSILIKDSDNYFELKDLNEEYNYISISNLKNFDSINAANKSYVRINKENMILEIVEKQIISDIFSIGGYYFKNSSEFCKYFEKISSELKNKEVYISDVIQAMLMNKEIFFIKEGHNYKDWGTLQDWLQYKSKINTYFIDIDGVLFENGAQYFEPYWGTTKPILENIEKIKELKSKGNYIIITTSRTEKYREITLKQFKEVGLEYDQLVMGIGNGKRIIINDFSNSNPYPSCEAINIERNSRDLDKYIKKD